MIAYETVLQWLNHFDTSNLSADVAAMVSQLSPALTNEQLDNLLYQLLSTTRKNKIPLEHAEALLFASQIKYERGHYQDTLRLLEGAQSLYTRLKDYHRLAVAKWLLSMTLWKTTQALRAFKNGYESREIMRAFQERYAALGMPAYKNWYAERIFEMDVSFACTFEEPYTWLDQFEPSRLSPASQRISQVIRKTLTNDPAKAESLMLELQKIGEQSADFMEQAEILLECGRTYYQLGNGRLAEKFLQRAAALFPPGQHHQAVALWLCGFVQWEIDGQKNRAVQNWQKSSHILGSLAENSMHKNRLEQSAWYRQKEKVTSRALEMTMTLHFS